MKSLSPVDVAGEAPAPITPDMHTNDTLRSQLYFLIEEAEALRVVLPYSPDTLVRERPRPDQFAVVETFQAIAWLDVYVRMPTLLGQADVPSLPDAFPLDLSYDALLEVMVSARQALLNAIPSDLTPEQSRYLWHITQEDAEMLRQTGSFLLDAQRLG